MPPAPALPELQALFWQALGGDVRPDLTAAIASTDTLGAADRVAIYADMYLWRLRGVLAEDFEKVAAVLGEDGFTDLARAYLAAHPSEHPSVRHVGRSFADYLARRPPAGAPVWVPDLARLEWARVEAFDALDAEPVRAADLCALAPEDWPDLTLRPIPALLTIEAAWPVHRVWSGDTHVDAAPTALRIWRQDGVVYHCAMDGAEPDALARLREGRPFAAICEAWGDLPPEEAAGQAGALLARWIEDGLIASLHLPS